MRAAPDHLTDGGWCQILANWVIAADRPWDERLAGWLADDCDALVVQREVVDPAAYVELWLKDAGLHGAPDYLERYDTWLSWFEDQRIEAVGFGWVNLRRARRDHRTGHCSTGPTTSSSRSPTPSATGATPRGVEVGLGSRLVARPDLVQEALGPVGAEDPATIVLRQQRGFRRAHQADTVLAALVGACDGELTLGQILDAVATLLELDAEETRAAYLPQVRELVAAGFLVA